MPRDMRPEVELNFANAIIDPWSGGVEIFLADKQPGKVMVVSAIECTVHQDGDANPPAPIKLTKQAATILINALWTAGLRPSGELDSIGHLAVLKAHLEDMRQLTFKTLAVEKP